VPGPVKAPFLVQDFFDRAAPGASLFLVPAGFACLWAGPGAPRDGDASLTVGAGPSVTDLSHFIIKMFSRRFQKFSNPKHLESVTKHVYSK